jgi:hypothetical protein
MGRVILPSYPELVSKTRDIYDFEASKKSTGGFLDVFVLQVQSFWENVFRLRDYD